MSSPRVLVIDGNVTETRHRQIGILGYDAATGYARVLRRLLPGLECDLVFPADIHSPQELVGTLGQYDGAAVTGSALCIADGGSAVDRQIELIDMIFEAGVPLFGSCWGLQLAVTAAGGSVTANPSGREFGFARRIQLTEAGQRHALYAGKPAVFEAPTVHRDYVAQLPEGAQVLATNEMGIQAAAFSYRHGTCWGVQYHPEYDYRDIWGVTRRYGQALVEARIFACREALDEFAQDMEALEKDSANRPLLWKHGLGPAMLTEQERMRELANWLMTEVLPRARGR